MIAYAKLISYHKLHFFLSFLFHNGDSQKYESIRSQVKDLVTVTRLPEKMKSQPDPRYHMEDSTM